MAGTYETRKIGTYDKKDVFVSTAEVTDSDQPYETAVAHPRYNDDELVIVEMYETRKQAEKGHKKWVKKMTAKKLPKTLKDVSTAEIAKLCRSLS
jgi:hypothetical protein